MLLTDFLYFFFYMKVMCYPEEKGLGVGVATTGKRACETPIHSWRGRLAAPLPTPTFMLRCEIHFMGVYMKVMLLHGRRGIRWSVDTTIHSLRGRLATLLRIPVTLLSCFVVKFISWELETLCLFAGSHQEMRPISNVFDL